jgi:flagellar biosynthesis/type III secretory pathway M-ring protein FliF/YscJ
MSISVLVGQEMRWQGAGKARQRVAVPPDPETLKTIRELVAAVTGFDEDRGDQLIVDSLPFEGNLLADPLTVATPTTAPDSKTPPWQELFKNYWHLVLLAVLGLAVIAVLLVGASKRRSGVPAVDVELRREVAPAAPVPVVAAPSSPGAPALAPPVQNLANDILGQTRASAQKDPNVSANVLRMWLQDLR